MGGGGRGFWFQLLSVQNISSLLWMMFLLLRVLGAGVHIPLHSLSDFIFLGMGTNKKRDVL